VDDECTVEHGTKNVFADLGFPDAEEHKAKVDLAIAIKHRFGHLGLTQEELGQRNGLSQADVSKITRGIVRGFTFDRLFRILGTLDQTVHIRVEAGPGGPRREHMTVEIPAAG